MQRIIQKYFQAWLDVDHKSFKDIFSDNVIYSECYGPEYRGLTQLIQWFEDWNKKGKVLEWTIKQTIEHNKTVVVEWYFKCYYEGEIDGFDGVTIAAFDDNGKIFSLKEFQSKAEHYFPYEGESEIKKLFVFVSFTTEESDFVCNKMVSTKPNQEFLGFWGKIEFNFEECLNTIAATVDHFINSDKEEIYFGVDENDLDTLLHRINTEHCEVIKISRDEYKRL